MVRFLCVQLRGSFNQALLANQAWRLIDNPGSLCARLLKAKYFPNGNLLDIVFFGNASAFCKGIEYGLELVKKGVIWKNSVRASRDPWIPRGPSLRPITPKRNCRYNRVSNFMDENGAWIRD